jgi:cation transporter-like permease
MQTQAGRDEKSLQIFTGLLIFMAVLGAGGIVLALAYLTVGVPEALGRALFLGLVAGAAVLTVAYLLRQKQVP